jgi:hypothetical protein
MTHTHAHSIKINTKDMVWVYLWNERMSSWEITRAFNGMVLITSYNNYTIAVSKIFNPLEPEDPKFYCGVINKDITLKL